VFPFTRSYSELFKATINCRLHYSLSTGEKTKENIAQATVRKSNDSGYFAIKIKTNKIKTNVTTSSLIDFRKSFVSRVVRERHFQLITKVSEMCGLGFLEFWHSGLLFWMTATCLSDSITLLTLMAHKEPSFFFSSGGFVVCPAELIRSSVMLLTLFPTGPRSWFIPSFFFFFMFPPAALDALRNTHITPQGQIWEMKTSQRRNSHTCAWNLFTSPYYSSRSTHRKWYLKNPSRFIRLHHRFLKIWKLSMRSPRFVFLSVHPFLFCLIFTERGLLSNLSAGCQSGFFRYMFPHNKYSTYLALEFPFGNV